MSARLQQVPAGRYDSGLTLVELMIAMLLGLVVLAGAASIFLANKQSYRTNEALSQVQESARTAFELLARDLREAGVTGCDNAGRLANVLNNASTIWWAGWQGLRGYDGVTVDPAVAFGAAAPGQRIAGTHSLHVQSIQGAGLSVASHDPGTAAFQVNALAADVSAGDILIVCDFDHAAIFQATASSSNATIVHSTDGSVTPGNCSHGLGFPSVCTAMGNPYRFGPNSHIARLGATAWYIGNNGRADEGGRSLYRRRLASGGNVVTEEVVPGITHMQLQYRLEGHTAFLDPGTLAASDWPSVNAVSITFVLSSAEGGVSTDLAVASGRLQRHFSHIVTLRNRTR